MYPDNEEGQRSFEIAYQAMYDGDLDKLNELTDLSDFPCGTDAWLCTHWLTHAIHAGNPTSVEWILGYSPDLTHVDLGETFLMTAVSQYGTALEHKIGKAEDAWTIVRLLLAAGVDINQAVYSDETVLHKAAYHAPIEIIRLLLDEGADPFAMCTDYASGTPAGIAKDRKRWDVHALLREAMGQTPSGRSLAE